MNALRVRPASGRPISAGQFRTFFRHHAAGVVIITAATADGPVGFTASSLASVSSDPPLVSFNVSRTSSSWAALQQAEHVAIHRLSVNEAELASVFARRGSPRFEAADWTLGPHGVPVLSGPRSWLSCTVTDRIAAGDSTLLLALVHTVHERAADGGDGAGDETMHPLVYAGGAYARPLALADR